MKKKVPPVGAEGLKPISGKELDELSAKAGVTSLSTQDVRRLLADYRRLRQIVLDAYPYVPDNERLFERIKDEIDRK